MNVAVLTTISRMAGGLYYSVRGLSKALAERGCSPVVLSPRDTYSAEDAGEWHPLPVELFPAYGPLQSSPAMRRRLMAMDTDLIHVHGIWLDSQWAALKRQKRNATPVVVSPRGMLDPWALRNSSWKKRVVERLFASEALERATCINALCQSEVDSIRAYGLKNPVAVIPNGVVLPDLAAVPQNRGGPKKLLFLGRIHPKKGLKELLQAWAMRQRDAEGNDDWQLIIAGWDDGGHDAGLKALAGELKIEASVDFAGPVYGDEKDRLLRSVDAFILPSFSEGLPMSVLEAWSYGLPVIKTDFCNLPEGFENGAAFRIEPDADNIMQGLKQFFAFSDAERNVMGSNGRALVENRFSWMRIAEQMQSVYAWCIDPSGTPPECIIMD